MYEGTSFMTIDDNVLSSGRLHTTRVDMWLWSNGGLLISRVKLKELGQKLPPLSICVQISHGHPGLKSRAGGEKLVSYFRDLWQARTVIKCGSAELCPELQSICSRNRFWICVQHIPSSVLVLLPTIRTDSHCGLPQCPERCRDSNCVEIFHVRLPQSPYLIASHGNVPMQLVL